MVVVGASITSNVASTSMQLVTAHGEITTLINQPLQTPYAGWNFTNTLYGVSITNEGTVKIIGASFEGYGNVAYIVLKVG